MVQSSEFHPANVTGQTLQGMQTAGMTGALGLNSQIRDNGQLSYSTQRINQGQMRQKQSSQSQIPSNQVWYISIFIFQILATISFLSLFNTKIK